MKRFLIFIFFACLILKSEAQGVQIDLEHALELGLNNNNQILARKLQIKQKKQLGKSAFSLEKTEVFYGFDQNNIAPNNIPIQVIGLSQSVKFPTFYAAQKKVLTQEIDVSKYQLAIDKERIQKEITLAYYTAYHWQKMVKNYYKMDSIYMQFAKAAKERYKIGETNNLEFVLAQSKSKETSLVYQQSILNYQNAILQLNAWIQSDTFYTISSKPLNQVQLEPLDTAANCIIQYLKQVLTLKEQQFKTTKLNTLPDFNIELFQGSNQGNEPNRFLGLRVGILLPLAFKANNGLISAANTEIAVQEKMIIHQKTQLQSKYLTLINDLKAFENGIAYFQNQGSKLYQITLSTAYNSYKLGEINYLQYVQLLNNANSIMTTYLQNSFFYNITVIEANHILQ